MYRCTICSTVTRPGQPLIRHTIYRQVPARTQVIKVWGRSGTYPSYINQQVPPRTEIATELPVCARCAECLKGGHTLSEMLNYYRNVRPKQVGRVDQATQVVPCAGTTAQPSAPSTPAPKPGPKGPNKPKLVPKPMRTARLFDTVVPVVGKQDKPKGHKDRGATPDRKAQNNKREQHKKDQERDRRDAI